MAIDDHHHLMQAAELLGLGHKSPTLTAKVYTHLMRERFEEGRTRLEQYMDAQRRPPADLNSVRAFADASESSEQRHVPGRSHRGD